jgi:hypothetical protein
MAFFYIDANAPLPNPATPQPISAGAIYEATARFVVPAGQADASVVKMVPVPPRARVVEAIVSTQGQAATVAVGDGEDDDRYIASAAVTAGQVSRLNRATGVGFNYIDADTIDIKFGAAPTAGGIVLLTVLYVIE